MVLITPKKCSQKQNKSKSDIANWKRKIQSDMYWGTADDYSAPTKGKKKLGIITKDTKDKAENIIITLKNPQGLHPFWTPDYAPCHFRSKRVLNLLSLSSNNNGAWNSINLRFFSWIDKRSKGTGIWEVYKAWIKRTREWPPTLLTTKEQGTLKFRSLYHRIL